ncbi:MAG TPA: DUF1801 domain-containing protein [Dehalococcoidia bacterium]|nr:DUF1801 domain-containing protein [Dehalococcoidia bacterium]
MAASDNIDKAIAELTGWRGERMATLRGLINNADPRLSEDWKWGTPVWTYKGNVCGIAAFKEHLKVNFFKGAGLEDPNGLFNAGLEARDSRSIDIAETDKLDESALQDLIRAAANQNEKK